MHDPLQSPTMLSPAAMTGMGVILGTAAYMAPEQARGRAVDRRADIWAFGVVLFEMLTGRFAFHGDTISDTVAAVLTRELEWRALPPGKSNRRDSSEKSPNFPSRPSFHNYCANSA